MENDYINNFTSTDYKSFSSWLFSLNAYEFSLTSTLIAYIIAPTLTINEQNSLGTFFQQLGQIISTINAQNSTISQKQAAKPGIIPEREYASLNDEVLNLKKEVINLREQLLNNNPG